MCYNILDCLYYQIIENLVVGNQLHFQIIDFLNTWLFICQKCLRISFKFIFDSPFSLQIRSIHVSLQIRSIHAFNTPLWPQLSDHIKHHVNNHKQYNNNIKELLINTTI